MQGISSHDACTYWCVLLTKVIERFYLQEILRKVFSFTVQNVSTSFEDFQENFITMFWESIAREMINTKYLQKDLNQKQDQRSTAPT